MYRIHQIKLGINQELPEIPNIIKKKLNIPDLEILEYKIIKESIDARNKSSIKRVYTVDFTCNQLVDCEEAPIVSYSVPKVESPKGPRPVVIGFGPCGLFAALILAEAGLKPLVLERGKAISQRDLDVKKYWEEGILDPESNVQFGEGGAGTFSDGKLTTGIKDPRIKKVLEQLHWAGGGDEVLYRQKPHIGTDLLKGVIVKLREKIIDLGGEIRFSTKVSTFKITDGTLEGVVLADGEIINTDKAILAVGHSSRDTFEELNRLNVNIEQKPFSMGVRISHSQDLINTSQYGNSKLSKILGPAEYKLSHRCKNGRGVYTFCMCPGGEIIEAATEAQSITVNGMSYHSRNGKYANSGLLVDVRTDDFGSDHPLAGIQFQRKYEKLAYIEGGGKPPETLYGQFKDSPVARSLPDFVVDSILEAMPYLGRKLKGFDGKTVKMVGVETRSSCPIRIMRDQELNSNITGLIPAGEGAGYAGGIVSAAVDGIRAAEAVINKYMD